MLDGVRELAEQGFITGASGRNWASYGEQISLPEGFAGANRALLTDPQTSGGLLVSCTQQALPAVLEILQRHGFGAAAEIGTVLAGPAGLVIKA